MVNQSDNPSATVLLRFLKLPAGSLPASRPKGEGDARARFKEREQLLWPRLLHRSIMTFSDLLIDLLIDLSIHSRSETGQSAKADGNGLSSPLNDKKTNKQKQAARREISRGMQLIC